MNPISLLKPNRKITGSSAILLPFTSSGEIDWVGFDLHVERTLAAGLTPAVNMDTGYANLIDESTRNEVLRRTQSICAGGEFIAGVYVADRPGAAFDLQAYQVGLQQILHFDGTPILFQSYGLVELPEPALVEAYRTVGHSCDKFLFFELGHMFAAFGRIYSLEVYEELMRIPTAAGAKHSSLRRDDEWQRLELRDRVRPEFKVFTGNDLAIDMVMYGSDYLLGLSTFAPEAFALRDSYWHQGDSRFYELNDLLQYLGAFAFRAPTSAYKHSAAMFLHLRGLIATHRTHPDAPSRPTSDREVLSSIADDLDRLTRKCTGVSS